MMLQTMPELGPMIRALGYWGVPPERAAVRTARHWLSNRIAGWWPEPVCTAASVIATELLTNAILHGRPPVTLAVNERGNGLTVEVADGSSKLPMIREYASPLDEFGRGLQMVKTLSDGWGFWYSPGYKCVYAILKQQYE